MTDATQVKAAAESECDTNRSIHTSGTAVVNVLPDRALIQLGVQSNGATPDGVHAANLQEIQRVIAAVKSLRIEAKDIATDYYIVYPLYSDYDSMTIKGYRIDNTVSITLRDVSLVDDTIMEALRAGANEVQDVQFYTSELRKYRDQARDMAIKAAGEKAQALAEAGGAQAGCIIDVSENYSSHYFGSWRGGRVSSIWTQNVMQNMGPSNNESNLIGAESPVALGQIAIQAQVNVSYSLQ